jgi:hypothetical protein
MAKRRRLPKIDPCKVNIRRLKNLSERQLMSVWVSLGASRVSHTNTNSLLKGIVTNYAAAKSCARQGQKQGAKAYARITRKLVKDFEKLRANACGIGPRGGVRYRS